ncbi:hypothetical protein [Cognatishimia activa]|uniref:hypothetical protein n=1 Tax=Cognatishimia activa TaxID=1715691 RepID=UPI00223290C9|nr:hypothetical protein [Cognatishimia activa]UZD90623.1 hypothetical protein M0D42_13665 [Cognatishimia activa]
MIASKAQIKSERWSSQFKHLFRQQFVLTRQSNLSYPGFNQRALQGWVLHTGQAMRVAQVYDATGTQVGFLLGVALQDGTFLSGDITVPASQFDKGFIPELDKLVNSMAGRFVLIILGTHIQEIYVDPVCDMPVVFDPAHQIVGSSVALILHRGYQPNKMFNLGKILRGGRTFTLQHTVDSGIFRTLPNHALDLVSFDTRRHWPSQDIRFNDTSCDPESIVSQIVDRLGRNFGEIVSNFPCIVPMTGGRDSRSLIASGHKHLDKVTEFSAFKFHNSSAIDAARGREIMQQLGFGFKTYGRKPISQRSLAEFHLKTGYTGIRGEIAAMGAVMQFPKDHVVVRGNIMELLRANQWRQRHIDNKFIMTHALRRLKADAELDPHTRTFRTAYRGWRKSLPTEDLTERPYDMAFVEFLLPNTQGAFFNGYQNNVFLNPFNDRHLIELSLRLPVQMRYDDQIHKKILAQTRPELLEIPYH